MRGARAHLALIEPPLAAEAVRHAHLQLEALRRRLLLCRRARLPGRARLAPAALRALLHAEQRARRVAPARLRLVVLALLAREHGEVAPAAEARGRVELLLGRLDARLGVGEI